MKFLYDDRFRGYNKALLRKDLISGLIVGIIAIPLGMAFAIGAGVKPQYGLYTVVIAGILISLFGGSKFQIGGPTGAFIPILFAIVLDYGYENLLLAGLMAGVILVLMGVLRLGVLMKYIPRPVTIGFTSGIAVIIFTGQIATFLGLRDVQRHEGFIANIGEVVEHIGTISIATVIVAVTGLLLQIGTKRFIPSIPGPLVGLAGSTLLAVFLFRGDVATIGSMYGGIPQSLPGFHFPEITLDRLHALLGPAFVIAMLGAIESLLSAVVADGMAGTRHNSNRELIGQGIANILTPLFGGIPATGAIARTATNIKNGAASPLSGVFHGITVLVVLVAFAPFASRVPLAGLAPILMIVAVNMSEYREFIRLLKTRTADSLVLVATFALTVVTDLTTAVEVGLGFAAILFIKRMSDLHRVEKVLPNATDGKGRIVADAVKDGHDCPQVSIFSIEGPLFFGAASFFEESIMNAIGYRPRILILKMKEVPLLDTTGESNLEELVKHFDKHGGKLLVSGIRTQPLAIIKKTGLYDRIGEEHFFEHIGNAVNRALTMIDEEKCIGCKHNAFRECGELSEKKAGHLPRRAAARETALPKPTIS